MQCNKLRTAAGRLLAGGCAPAKHDAHCCVGKHAVQQAAYCCRPAAGWRLAGWRLAGWRLRASKT
jgi:hypothetical protein